MRKLIVITWLTAISATVNAAPEEFVLDSDHTFPTFEVRHLGIATQRGRFNRTAGKIFLDLDAAAATVDINIDARSATTGSNALDKLLHGRDYFAVDTHPSIVYTASNASLAEGRQSTIDGQLTFLGVTRPVQLKVINYACTRRPLGTLRCGADMTATFRRSDFGMTTMLSFVSDEVTVLIQAEAVRAAPPAAPK